VGLGLGVGLSIAACGKKSTAARGIILADAEGEALLQLRGARRLTDAELGESAEDITGLKGAIIVMRTGIKPWTGGNAFRADDVINSRKATVRELRQLGAKAVVYVPAIIPWTPAIEGVESELSPTAIRTVSQMVDTWARRHTGSAPEADPFFDAFVSLDGLKAEDGMIAAEYADAQTGLNVAGVAKLSEAIAAAVAQVRS
jgi:hypothetical protein